MKDLTHLDVSDYFQILWNRKWYFLAVWIIVSCVATFSAMRIQDVYKSEARVTVDTTLSSGEIIHGYRTTPEEQISSIREQLESRTFLERMIEQFQLYNYGTKPDFDMAGAVRAAQNQIRVTRAPSSDKTFTISFIAQDPQYAQTVTKQLTQELIRGSNQTKTNKVMVADQFIDERMRQSKIELDAQEEKIKQFRIRHQGAIQENTNMNLLSQLNDQLSRQQDVILRANDELRNLDFVHEERKKVEANNKKINQTIQDSLNKLDPVRPVVPNERRATPDEIKLAEKEAKLEELKSQYTSKHPDVVVLANEVAKLKQQINSANVSVAQQGPGAEASAVQTVQSAQAAEGEGEGVDTSESVYNYRRRVIVESIARAEKNQQDLQQRISEARDRVSRAPDLESEYQGLLREKSFLEKTYADLQAQKTAASVATAIETDKKNESYRVVDEASFPSHAESRNKVEIILMGVLGGLIFGIGAAFARELLDNTIGSEEEAKRVFNLPVLVVVPTMDKKDDKKDRRPPRKAA